MVIQKKIFTLGLIFATNISLGMGPGFDKQKATEILKKQRTSITTDEMLQKFNSHVSKINASADGAKKGVETANEHLGKIEVLQGISAVADVIKIADAAVGAVSWAKSYVMPSENDLYYKEDVNFRLRTRKTERKFYECLRKHAEEEKDKVGTPVACNEVAEELAEIIGYGPVNQLKKDFRDFYENRH